MSNDLNKCMFIGRLGADPDTRHMQNGKAVTNIRIAVGSSWRDKSTGEKKESTEWVSVSAFDKLAEIMERYLTKGSQVYIEGKLQTRKYQAKDGSDRYTTEIIAQQMQMLGGGGERKEQKREQRSAPSPAPDFDDDLGF